MRNMGKACGELGRVKMPKLVVKESDFSREIA